MTTEILTFKQLNPPGQPHLLAEGIRLIGKILRHNPASYQGYCQVRPRNAHGEGASGMFSPGCDGEIIYHVLAGGLYPTRILF